MTENRSGAADPLESLQRAVAFSSLDWAAASDTAWVYGVICGWDCEIAHRHDADCGGGSPIIELVAKHGWTPARVAQLRALRTRWLQLHDLAARQSLLEAENIALLARLAFNAAGNHR